MFSRFSKALHKTGHIIRWAVRWCFHPAGKWMPPAVLQDCASRSSVIFTIVTSAASGRLKSRIILTTIPIGPANARLRRRTGDRSIWCSHEEKKREYETNENKRNKRKKSEFSFVPLFFVCSVSLFALCDFHSYIRFSSEAGWIALHRHLAASGAGDRRSTRQDRRSYSTKHRHTIEPDTLVRQKENLRKHME